MGLIRKNSDHQLLKPIVTGIISVLVLFVPLAYAHEANFEVKTTEDILRFCEFYFDEYEYLGLKTLVDQHPSFPNLRACSILYEHVAWKSTHEARDRVLISIIEKYLGNSDIVKERHIREYEKMPQWVKSDTQLWVNGYITDARFAYTIRSMLDANFIIPPNIDTRVKECLENICFKEEDFAKYQYTNKYGNTILEKYTIKSISDNGILVESHTTTREDIIKKEFLLNEQYKTPLTEICCKNHKFVFSIPVKTGNVIEGNFKIIGDTLYSFKDMARPAVIATNLENNTIAIIDKETGLLLSLNHEEKNIITVWEKTQLLDTNMFGSKPSINYEKMSIPKWWKTTTMWFSEGHISEREYMSALENIIARDILRV